MQQRRRLNLFAFTPETNALFSMLILASIMLALFLGNASRFFFGTRDPLASTDITARGLEITAAVLPIIGLSGMAAFGTLGIAFILYIRHPSQIRRRRKIQPLTEKDHEIQEHVSKLALQTGVDSPRIEMPPQGLKGTDAQAFGIGNTHTIALDGGFRVLRKTKPDVFNALLHHELAHFANADIGRSYFSDALWKSIRWLIVLPFVLWIVGNVIIGLILGVFYGDLFQSMGAMTSSFGLFVQFSFVIAVAAAIWARLLRTREFYADSKAVLWGSQSGLNKIFQEETEKERPKMGFNLWKFHPDAKERMDAMEHPEIFFNLSPMFVFLAGLLLSFIFAGLQFSFATFLGFHGYYQIIRDSLTGLLYWFVRGMWLLGFAFLIFFIFGSIGWLINGVLLPQIQKQVILDLVNKQSRLMQYLKLGITSLVLVAGIELGFFMTPLDVFAPNELMGIQIEFLVISPVLVVMACWNLTYIRFITLRLSATQLGRNFSIWRSRFITITSTLWIFLFFAPGIILSRFLEGSVQELFIYRNLGWLAFTILLSPIVFAVSWVIIKLFFDSQPKKCPHCGKITEHSAPAIELCEHCGGVLGEWLFVPEKSLNT